MYIKTIFKILAVCAILAGCSAPRGRWSVDDTGATTTPAAMQYGTYEDGENHRMAVLLPMTGDAAASGRAIRTSVEMAVLETGADNLNVSFFDSALGQAAVSDALDSDPEVIVGPLFANDARLVRDMKSSSLPVLSFTSDATAVGDGIMTMALMPTNSVEAIVREMQNDKVHNFIVIAPDTESGHLLAGAASTAAEMYNIQLSGAFFYTERNSDSIKSATEKASMNVARTAAHTRAREILSDVLTTEALTSIERSSVIRQLDNLSKNDVIGTLPYDAVLFLGTGEDTKSLASFMRYFGVGARDARFYGTAMWDGADIASDLTLSGAKYAALPDMNEGFITKYEHVAGAKPTRLGSIGYDATNMAIGMLYSGKSHAAYLLDPSGYAGVDGIVRLRPNGDSERAMRIMQLDGSGEIKVVKDAATDFMTPLYNIEQRRISPIGEMQLQTRGVNPMNYITLPERIRGKYKSKTYGANMTAQTNAQLVDIVSVVPEDTNDAVVLQNYKPVKLAPVKQTYIDSIEVEE